MSMRPNAERYLAPCGGFSPITGKKVGSRHRWDGRKWGEGYCEFCHRPIEQLWIYPRNEMTLQEAIAANEKETK
jgi:hypothetical protein